MSVPSDTLEGVQRQLLAYRSELLVRQGRIASDLARRREPLVTDWDQAIQTQNDEPLQAIALSTRQEIEGIDEAVARLKLGLYGMCKHCGQ